MLFHRRIAWFKATSTIALVAFLIGVEWPCLHADSNTDDDDVACKACQLQEKLAAVVPEAPVLQPVFGFTEEPVVELPESLRIFLFVRATAPRAPPSFA